MLNFSVSSEIFEKLPGLKVGMVVAYGLDQERLPSDILERIHKKQAGLLKELSNYSSYKDFPVVKAWH